MVEHNPPSATTPWHFRKEFVLSTQERFDPPEEITLDIEYYYSQLDLVIKLIEEGRSSAAIHMLRQSKNKFKSVKPNSKVTILPA